MIKKTKRYVYTCDCRIMKSNKQSTGMDVVKVDAEERCIKCGHYALATIKRKQRNDRIYTLKAFNEEWMYEQWE